MNGSRTIKMKTENPRSSCGRPGMRQRLQWNSGKKAEEISHS
jgi:hypothetical protein